jgi:DNA-directed RNA polymerase
LLAEGKKLGPTGLDMLKLHVINLTGTMKKCTLDERIAYANKILDDIIDSAERPLEGRGWWKKSEEKWQTLACCMEINAAIKSGNPVEYVSHFPVHQDGSCNGLQHYAALGRDKEGANSVNLSPSHRPQDVYTSVLELVENERQKEEENKEIAKLLKDKITRKTIKQTIMTTVYNVTFYGAKLQIQNQLEDIADFPCDKIIDASGYIADKTFESIKRLFKSAREIQDWLSECAYLVSKVNQEPVKWETPLGLEVIQPYFRKHLKKGRRNDIINGSVPNYRKQRNAFPPNFIHSLDSSHMMLTSLYCNKANVTFVSVHDSFWTHACTVDIMNRICREQFVALHSLPIIESLSDYFVKKYGFSQERINSEQNEKIQNLMIQYNKKIQNVPVKGEFNLNDVLKSLYFFS